MAIGGKNVAKWMMGERDKTEVEEAQAQLYVRKGSKERQKV